MPKTANFSMISIRGESKMKKYNLVVAGGGLTGVAAAVSAAREGLSVLLIEKVGSLGGAMTNSLVYPFMEYWTTDPKTKEKKFLSAGIFAEMRSLHQKFMNNNHLLEFKPEYFKFTLDELVTGAGVELLFHGMIFKTETEKKKITKVSVATKAGIIDVEADFFIDATGDGALFYLAGCDYQIGRNADNLCQPMTTCFRMSGVDMEKFAADRSHLQEAYKQEQLDGIIKNPREDILIFQNIGEGILHFNTTRIIKLDPTDPFEVSKAEIEARRQVAEMDAFLKRHSVAFKNATIINIATEIGVRESRKLKGVHILTERELRDCTIFEDSIALGNYDIDIHNPAGSGTSHYYFAPGEYYSIPYRSLLPREYTNLLVAGRCLSATHEAQASVRIMPICATMGEAAGVAVATAYKTNKNTHTVDVTVIQEKLVEKGAAIK